MKIRTALTLKITCATAAVFLLCMILIYVVSEKNRSEAFFRDLRGEAVTKAHLFLAGQADARTMQSIYLNNKKFINEVEVAVYTPDFKMLYHDAIQNDIIKETRGMIGDILKKGEINFYTGKYQGMGMVYVFGGEKYVVTAAAYDGYGHENLIKLQEALLAFFIVGLSLLFATSYFLAKISLKPIRHIVNEAESISASRIDSRLPVKNKNDELGELSTAFNGLLGRLESSFNSQKMFVSNVSHELRTPLAAIIAELDLTLQKDRSANQYRKAMENILQDARQMTKLIDGLLNLAKADFQKTEIKMQEIRLDELLLDVRETILKAHANYHISLLFGQEADDDSLITVFGNPYLLNTAFSNLIENNCKYSENNASSIQISFLDKWTIVRLSDNGVGMSEEDKRNLFKLFYRGNQGNLSVEGHGIGMALAQKIILMHQGDIAVHSVRGNGTTFVVRLPHVG